MTKTSINERTDRYIIDLVNSHQHPAMIEIMDMLWEWNILTVKPTTLSSFGRWFYKPAIAIDYLRMNQKIIDRAVKPPKIKHLIYKQFQIDLERLAFIKLNMHTANYIRWNVSSGYIEKNSPATRQAYIKKSTPPLAGLYEITATSRLGVSSGWINVDESGGVMGDFESSSCTGQMKIDKNGHCSGSIEIASKIIGKIHSLFDLPMPHSFTWQPTPIIVMQRGIPFEMGNVAIVMTLQAD